MAFDRSALAWKNLNVVNNGRYAATSIDRLTDQQILGALGNGRNNGALAAGWQFKNGQVTRVQPAAPPPAPRPVAPPAPAPRPQDPRGPAFNTPPVPAQAPKFNRASIKWGSLYMPVQGQPGMYKAVKLDQLTDDQIRNALKNQKNRGALADGWSYQGGKVLNRPAPTPVGPAAPQVDPNTGYFFNPFSNTLWSRRNADGSIEMNVQPPADGNLLQNMDLAGVSQYKLPGAGAGNTIGFKSLTDANAFLGETGATQELLKQLMPGESKLAALNKNINGQGTMYDIAKRDYLSSWDDKVNAAMGSLAARGMYNGGARRNSLANAAQERAAQLLNLDQQYGDLARQTINQGQEDARRQFGLTMLQMMIDSMMTQKQNDIAEALA